VVAVVATLMIVVVAVAATVDVVANSNQIAIDNF